MTKYRLAIIAALSVFLYAQTIGSVTNPPAETHAIVEMSEKCLIGGAQNQKWLDSNRIAKSLKAREKFSLYTLKGPAGEITFSKIAGDRDCAGEWSAETSSKAEAGVAIASPTWNVMPRIPRAVDLKDTTYVTIVSDILKKEGIKAPEVKITQAYKVDLDGDGKDEVVIVANRFAQGLHELSGVANATSAGDYTLVLVRKIVGEQVQNIFLVKAIWLKADEGPLPRANHLSAIADLNGDGVMELVLYSAYQEGSGSDVVQIKEAKSLGVLTCACEH
jgi:hypothetical protein